MLTSGGLRTAAAAAASVVVALVLAGCGGAHDGGGGERATTRAAGPTASDHDDADLTFALEMVPHHLQAVELADLVPSRTDDADLRELAARIRTEQQGEIGRLTTLLAAWGAAPDDAHSDSEHLEGAAANGMATDEELQALGAMRGAEFRAEWLRLMVAHHEGAVAMAREVLGAGTNAEVRALASAVVATQEAEIEEMRGMAGG